MINSMIQSQPKLRKRGGNYGSLRITGLPKWFLGLAMLFLIYVIRMTMTTVDPSNAINKGEFDAGVNLDTPSSFQDVKAHPKATPHLLLDASKMSRVHPDMKKRMEEVVSQQTIAAAERMRRVGIRAKVKTGVQGGTSGRGAEQRPQVRQDIKKRMEETQQKMAERMRRAGIKTEFKPSLQGGDPTMGGTLPGGIKQRSRIRGAQPLAH